jgi:hypothetical protein
MTDYETLKSTQKTYDLVLDLIDNCELIEDEDTRNLLYKTTDILDNLYNNAWELLSQDSQEHNLLETKGICPKCKGNLILSDFIGYHYLCNNCDENFYYTEADIKED